MNRIKLLQNHLSTTSSPSRPYAKIQVETLDDGSIGVISMNSPKDFNIISIAMLQEILHAAEIFSQDPKIKVVILRSLVPKVFCAGGDIRDFPTINFENQCFKEYFEETNQGLKTWRKPVIAVVNGIAVGGGLEISLASDIILMSDNAKIGLTEVKVGIIPGLGGTQRLAKVVGKHSAMKAILTGDIIPASEAYRMGICQGLYKEENLYEEAVKLARNIADKPVSAIIVAKKAVKFGEEVGLAEGLRFEREEINALFSTKGKEEGVKAFLEKRKPDFKDK